jgi:GNAT superfamily N-acetyltransferase
MLIREATTKDIKELHTIRMSVKENVLVDISKVTEKDYEKYLTTDGKGWLCELDEKILGFTIVDITTSNVWALFILPEYQGKGVGKMLQRKMVNWYFDHFSKKLWLTTGAGTKAESFYRQSGWKEVEKLSNGEIKFELAIADWKLKEKISL